MKNESLIASGLYGTWTFSTQTMTDIGYYKGRAYVIMHLMPDPMQFRSCQLPDCPEESNHLCQRSMASLSSQLQGKEECVDTEGSIVEWSDVTAFFQFGFQLRTGIAYKTYTLMNTSDWLGPYNLVMAPLSRKEEYRHEENDAMEASIITSDTTEPSPARKVLHKFVSRYVSTPASSQIQFPPDATILQPEIFDRMAGVTAINETIHMQQSLKPRQDPYADYRETCVKGDIPAGILPRIQLGMLTTTTTDDSPVIASDFTNIQTDIAMLRVDFSMLSVPDPKSKLYKLWPSLKKHLGSEFPLQGPYCYGNDPRRAYAIQLAYDSAFDGAKNQSWQVIKGCLSDLPCWSDDGPVVPYDNDASGKYVLDPTGLTTLVCYVLGFLLMVSLVFNCQLSNQLKHMQDQHGEVDDGYGPRHTYTATASGRPVPQQQVFDAFHDLEEPLLSGADSSSNDPVEQYSPENSGGAEESKVEAD
ncbi:hypothetical protein IV203_019405 [Nitzschia inconspicua]|uniref:Uncharacterized protein n=1 Tax=Nitzschia inconspicua TaxID=303405 RepID=A0A9K3LYK0_9STRA|nr:hypothetical protein IV203_019405 [Nitzschia inconspicua]